MKQKDNMRLYREFVEECKAIGVNPTKDLLENRIYHESQRKEYDEAISTYVLEYQKNAKKVFSSRKELSTFLDVVSKIPFSMSNLLLVYSQMPDASDIRSYDNWKKCYADIKEGAKAIYVSEPKKIIDQNGTRVVSYDKKAKFDVKDTIGFIPAPKIETDIETLIRGLIHDCPVKLETVSSERFSKKKDGAYYSAAERIIVAKTGMDQDEIFPKVAKAIVHSYIASGKKEYDDRIYDFEAQCVVSCLSKAYDVRSEYSETPEVPDSLKNADFKEHKRVLSTIVENFKRIRRNMDKFIGEELTKKHIQERLEEMTKSKSEVER
ncbi:MAG: hypothetical protein MJ236_00890 [Clostridia bacterium]|nr:hypothetical protein [Clostridia bacterium]